MEPVNPRRPDLFLTCKEEGGVPARLINEEDIHVLTTTMEMFFEAEDAGIGQKKTFGGMQQHVGLKGRITTHRLIWHCSQGMSTWLVLRLDGLANVQLTSALMRTQHCAIQLVSGRPVDVRFNDAQSAADFTNKLREACMQRRWLQGSYDVAQLKGMAGILAKREAKQQVVGETLDAALTDLSALKQHAAQAVAAARAVAAKQQQGGEADGVQGLLEEFGLMGTDGRLVVQGGTTESAIKMDVQKVCEAALTKRGGLGMLLAHDIFCLVNRARGTALVSPEEVMRALQACKNSGTLRLRTLGATGAWAASLPSTSDDSTNERLLKIAEAGPLSAFALGKELGLSTAEAQYLLRDAENRAVLVRDEAPDGVFYYRNFFGDDFSTVL